MLYQQIWCYDSCFCVDPLHIEKTPLTQSTWYWWRNYMKSEILQDNLARAMELLSVIILNEKPPSDFFSSMICWFAIHLTWKFFLPSRCFGLECLRMYSTWRAWWIQTYSSRHFKPFHFFRKSWCGLNVGPTTGFCPRCIWLFFNFSPWQAIAETDEQQPMLPDLDEVPAPIF